MWWHSCVNLLGGSFCISLSRLKGHVSRPHGDVELLQQGSLIQNFSVVQGFKQLEEPRELPRIYATIDRGREIFLSVLFPAHFRIMCIAKVSCQYQNDDENESTFNCTIS